MKQLALDIGLTEGPTLAGFFAGPNEAALTHLQVWLGASRPGAAAAVHSPVPTYLWGEGGSGKTHLLRAVGHALTAQGGSVGWLDASMTQAPMYDERWTAVLLDDVERYGAEQQHTAFNWFVNAQSLQRGVVAAGAMTPVHLKLRDDLRSRLGWGHVFHLQLLGEDQRRGVLQSAAEARGLALGKDVLDYLLHRFSRDLGSLMDLLDMLDGYAMQTQRAITIPMVRKMLEET